jgi:hypothetical protein
MKRLVILTVFFLAVLIIFVNGVSAICPTGMMGYWKFDGSSGGSAVDSSGSGNTGVLINPTIKDDSVLTGGKSLGFSDSHLSSITSNFASYIAIPDSYTFIPFSSGMNTTTFSLEAWFKMGNMPQDLEFNFNSGAVDGVSNFKWTLLYKAGVKDYGGYLESGIRNYELSIVNVTGNSYLPSMYNKKAIIDCRFDMAEGETTEEITNYHLVHVLTLSDAGRWNHVVCTLDGDNWKMYLNGNEVSAEIIKYSQASANYEQLSSLEGQGAIPYAEDNVIAPENIFYPIYYNDSALTVGTEYLSEDAGTSYAYTKLLGNLAIDEVAVYDRALSATEVAEHYNNTHGKDYCTESPIPPVACTSDQTIMKLYSVTNSHGALWNASSAYAISINYSEVFGECYNPPSGVSNVHRCDAAGNGKIVNLNGINNSHAAILPSTAYNVPVCYGSLFCKNVSSATECSAIYPDGRIILSLSATTNAHLAKGDFADYPIKICCTMNANVSFEGSYWADMIDNPIVVANKTDRVKMIVNGADLAGKMLNFTVYKDVPWWFDSQIAQVSGSATWLAGLKSDGSYQNGNYYFKARALGGSNEVTSNVLTVTNGQGSGINTPPNVTILTPKWGEIYPTNVDINFTSNVFDVDDFFTLNWSFGDGIVSTQANTVHRYLSSGQKNIRLEAIDERGAKGLDKTGVLICGGPGSGSKCLYSHITSPDWREIITGTNVSFNATQTFALSYDNVTGNLTCIAGLCPLNTTDGKPILPGSINSGNRYNNLTFNWTFIIGGTGEVNYRYVKGASGALFTQQFPATDIYHPHQALLSVSLDE